MALVRVYCGLASADSATRPSSVSSSLAAAVVDDAGRLLDVCEISDDPTGYARLGALLVARSSGLSGAAIAADSDDHIVTSLLTAAGRPLAIADDDAVDDFTKRFATDESADELRAGPAQRRAVGLARALQAGALSAVTLPVPRDLVPFTSALAAHAALANGRHAAAVALREVLRELYPAALRAYPDPAKPVSLAVLDALPEPGMFTATDVRTAVDAVVARLTENGIADAETVTAAVNALRAAVEETSARANGTNPLNAATAEAVRHAVAAVRAYDAASEALIATLNARVMSRAGHGAPQLPPLGGVAESSVPQGAEGSAAPAGMPAAPSSAPPAARPTSAPPAAPVAPAPRRPMTPDEAGEPFRAPLTMAALNRARADQRSGATDEPTSGFSATDLTVPVPTPRPDSHDAPPGSRARWPLVRSEDDRAVTSGQYPTVNGTTPGEERVTPPWLADDMPPEPPGLRLGESSNDSERREASPLGFESDPLTGELPVKTSDGPPVPDDNDGDLLIYKETRSAWFTARKDRTADLDWGSAADSGWRAAEQAAQPRVGEMTAAGLPRRVPQANLVPGSPWRNDRPLRIVRDPARIAAHTSGYFQGWRRGQQIGGYAIGGRPGRQSGGGWDFSRDQTEPEGEQIEYRPVGYRTS